MALGLCDYSMAGTDGRNCSSVNENTPGALQSFVIGPDGLLSDAVDTVASGGDAPAFTVPLSMLTRHALPLVESASPMVLPPLHPLRRI